MDMTKEQRIELREVKRRLRISRGTAERTLASLTRMRKKLEKEHRQMIQAADRELRTRLRGIEKDGRVALKMAGKEAKSLLEREAVLEGRLAS